MQQEGVQQEGVQQSDHSLWVQLDGVHCVLEKYFMDVQQACIAFYEHGDVITEVGSASRV